MHKTAVIVLISLATLCFASCAHTPKIQPAACDYNKFVHVAAIDPKAADHVGQVLERAGIHAIIEGSVVYGVSVPPGTESRATSLLQADSATHKYWIQFR